MWTVRKVTVGIDDRIGAGNAARYPLEASGSPAGFAPGGAGDDGPRAMAHWLGSEGALRRLGLEPGQAVTQEQLQLALQGRGMDGGQVRRPGWIHQKARDGKGKLRRGRNGEAIIQRRLGVASYDMTFSAPKSVSVVWSQAGPELRAKIERAMFEAWNTATQHLIRNHDVVMHGRVDGERRYGPAKGFAAAASLHVTARRAKGEPAPAPQLHVHGMLVGLERPDGILAGINSSVIYGDAALEAGAYARTLLAERLVEMGFEIESGTGQDGLYFEIAGVPKGLIDAFSGRTRDVNREAERLEDDLDRKLTKRERAVLAAITRSAKEGSPTPELTAAWWDARTEKFGFGPEAVEALRRSSGFGKTRARTLEDLAEAVETGMRTRGPAVTRGAARAIVVAVSSGRLPLAQAEELIGSLQGEGALLALEEGRVTTPWIRRKELEVVAAVRQAAERPRVPLSAEALAAGERYATARLNKGAGGSLKEDQVDAIAALSGGSGWSVLTGRAGTGKTPVLQAIAEAHRHDGWNVIPCAIDWKTAGELADDIGGTKLSIRQLVMRARPDRGARRDPLEVDERTLILIEEAGKVGLREWAALAELVRRTGARVLAVGHAGQLGAVELPGMFEEMVRHRDVVTVAELREIRRHKYDWMRELQKAIDDGKGDEAVAILRREKAITIYETQAEALEGMVERWFESRERWTADEATMILEGSNKDVDTLNQLAQQRLRRDGQLRGPGVSSPDRDYKFFAGDRVILRFAAWRLDPGPDGAKQRSITNATTGTVYSVDPAAKTMEVDLREPNEEPRRVTIDLGRRPRQRGKGDPKGPSWSLDYAYLPNPSQGMTIDSVNHGGGHWSQGQESSYVGLSRQVQDLHDHISRERLGGRDDEEVYRRYARMLSTPRRREASIRYGEAEGAKIGGERVAGHELPVPAARWATTEKETGVASRRLGERLDPLAGHRLALGESRAAWIERRADGYAGVVGKMNRELLLVERAEAREALERLDREGAMRTLALQRDRKAVEDRTAQALRHAETLKQLAARLGKDEKKERDELLRAARTQSRLASEDEEATEVLREFERELEEEGVHLDQWMGDEGDAAARYVALERELFARREPGLEKQLAETLREPPADVVEWAGPAPEVGSRAHEEWREVVWELECNRLIAEGELPAAEPTPAELRDLDRRAERLRPRGGSPRGLDQAPGSPGRHPN